MDELSPEARRVLIAARANAEPTASDRARVQAMISAAIAMPAASAAAATSVGGKVGVGATTGFLAKLGAAALVTSLTVAGGYGAYSTYTSRSGPSPAAKQTEPNVALRLPTVPVTHSVTSASVDTAAPSSTSTSMRRARSNAVRSARPSTPERSAQVAKEILWISSAESALEQRAPALALQALQQHARLFPQGELRQERLGLRAIALCTVNRNPATTQGARTYLAHYPSSILAERVRETCRVTASRGDK